MFMFCNVIGMIVLTISLIFQYDDISSILIILGVLMCNGFSMINSTIQDKY